MAPGAPDRARMEALLERLRADGTDAVWVDRTPVFDKATLLGALHEALGLPAWFGFNWDALQDALFGPDGGDAPPRVLVFRDLALLEGRDPETARTFLDIVRTVSSNPASTLRGLIRAADVA